MMALQVQYVAFLNASGNDATDGAMVICPLRNNRRSQPWRFPEVALAVPIAHEDGTFCVFAAEVCTLSRGGYIFEESELRRADVDVARAVHTL